MTQDAISCELHDFVEVACMYGYRLRLILKNDQVINSPKKRECLVIEGDSMQHIELTQLIRMQVLTPNAKFSEVDFQ